jgi:hypothetical protein
VEATKHNSVQMSVPVEASQYIIYRFNKRKGRIHYVGTYQKGLVISQYYKLDLYLFAVQNMHQFQCFPKFM